MASEPIGGLHIQLGAETAKLIQDLGKAKAHIRQFSGDAQKGVAGVRSSFSGLQQAAASLSGLAVFGGITAGIKSSAQSAIEFESAFAGVRKTVDETEEGFQELIQRFSDMSTAMPVSREELSRIAELAGQLGVSGVDNLTKFTDTIARIAVSTNLTTEQAATNFAQFANVIQLPLSEIDRVGAAIVALGNNFATTEADISNMAQRLSAAGKTVGLSASEILGFSAALSSVGIEAEAGGTAFSKVFIKLAEAASSGNAAFAELMGISNEAFQSLIKNNPAEATLKFVEALGRVKQEGGDLFAVLEELDLKEIRLRNALLSTANAGDLVRRSLDLSGQAFADNTALIEESTKRFATTESQLGALGNTLSNLSAEIGAIMLPALKDLAETMVPLVRSVIEWAKENPNLVKSLVAMAGAVAVGGALLAGIGAFAFAMTGLGAVGGPVLAGVAALAALVGAFVGLKDKVPGAVASLKSFVSAGLDNFSKSLADNATKAVNAVAGMLEKINDFFEGLPQRFYRSGVALVDEFAKGLAHKADAAVDAVKGMVGAVREYLPFSPAKEGPLSDLDKSGEAFGRTLAEGIYRGADMPVDAVEDLAQRLHSEIDIRGSIPTRNANGQFNGAIQRTGTGFLDGAGEALRSFVTRTQDSFAQGVAIAEAGISAMNNAVDQFSTDLVEGEIRNLGDAFDGLKKIAVESLKQIAKEIIKLAIIRAVTSAIGGGLSRAFGNQVSAGGRAFLAKHHGIKAASGADFMVGGRGGIDRNFLPMHVSRGERVIVETPAQQRNNRGGDMIVNIHNNAGDSVRQERQQTPDGTMLDIYIDRKVGESISRGKGRQVLKGQYGATQRARVG